MIPRMVTYHMAASGDHFHNLWISICSLADHEEGSAHAMFFEDTENTRCINKMRTVVKGNRGDRLLCFNVCYLERIHLVRPHLPESFFKSLG